MKAIIQGLLASALNKLFSDNALTAITEEILQTTEIKIDRTKDKSHGDFATNIAMMLAKPCAKNPRELATIIIQSLPAHPAVLKVEIAGPGFINFFMNESTKTAVIPEILKQQHDFGRANIGMNQKVLIEFVSANPTGPLHVGHGRGAAFGATLANLLAFAGFDVHREYYVNDAGRQMNILAASVWLRYLSALGEVFNFPANGYKGDYVVDIANLALKAQAKKFHQPWAAVHQDLPLDEPEGGDKELYIDAVIDKAIKLLGNEGFQYFHQLALNHVLGDIKDDLSGFGVHYDSWFSEQSLMDNHAIEKGIDALKASGLTFEEEGALWFKSTTFGDEKDRVLIRANGQYTYFASDVAYHWNKYDRGFDKLINIFGADHHGYIPRLKAVIKALGHNDEDLNILLVQFAILYRGDERVQMSTRSGSFVTLRELREEVGNDACRYFYVMRKPEQHMDFDLELAKSRSNDNPVYYIQYAHARICSVFAQLNARGFEKASLLDESSLEKLNSKEELHLLDMLQTYPDVIQSAANQCEPHQVSYYLRDLANALHSYYNAIVLLCEDKKLRDARMMLLQATRQVLKNGLTLLGVSAPESM